MVPSANRDSGAKSSAGARTSLTMHRNGELGVRKSMIINYVTNEWRAREQLAFPDKPIAA